MNSQQFRAQCPFCLETYLLDKALLGRSVACRKCRKNFCLKELDSSYEQTPLTPKSEADDSYEELSQSVINEFAERFPNPPQGVWPAGKLLLDGACQVLPFTKDRLYAEGGVGIVQRVRRRDWNVDLIVKSPKPGVVISEYGKESFERECQTWINLGLHANIVSCYFVRRIEGIPRLFAELAPDGTLNDWISSKRLYEGSKQEALARILDASIQFAWGLEHAHQQGLLHLDVKPGNVMTSGSTIKVTDFGLSKFVTESAETSEFVANNCDGMTPSYCSPEQYQAFQIYKGRRAQGLSARESIAAVPMTKQSDIWSWAISILAMFHGRSPCKQGGQTASKVFDVFLSAHRPDETRPSIPQGMIDLLRWCFRENPSERPESMQVVADQITQIYEEVVGKPYPRRQPQNAALTAESFSNRAISLLDLGQTQEALGLLDQASSASPNQPQIVFNQMLALWRTGKIRDMQAIQRLNDLIQNNANDPTSFYVFGLTHFERGNLKASINAFNHALELAPKRKDVKRSLEAAENLIQSDSQCITQYVLARPIENKTPSLFVDASGEFVLLELVDGNIALIKVQTGQTRVTFIKKSDASIGTNKVISAVSEDYKWSLESSDSQEITVSSATKTRGNKPTSQYKFYAADWDRLRPRIAEKIIRSPSGISGQDDQLTPSSLEWEFVPTSKGIEVIDRQAGQIQRIIPEEEQELASFAVTTDGKWLAIGGGEAKIKIWNVNQNRCVRTFLSRGGVVEALWFDPKKRVVISLAQGNICQIWRVTLICNRPKKIHAPHLLCLINSSEELQERQAQFEKALHNAQEAARQNDLNMLLNAYHSVKKQDGWENERGQFEELLERRIPRSSLYDAVQSLQIHAHEGAASTLAVSWDSSFFVSAGKDGVIRLWTSALQTSDNNKQNNLNGAKKSVIRPNAWNQAKELEYHTDWVRSIALSPNNRFLVSGGWDHRIALWDLSEGVRMRTLPEKVKNLTKLSFAPDGRTIAAATANGAVSLWDLATNESLLRLSVGEGYTRALSFSRDGRFFVSATDDSVVRFWTGRSALPLREIGGFPSNILTLDLSCDVSRLVVGCGNGKIYVVDLSDESGQKRKILSGHLGEVTALKLFPDNEWLVSTGKDKTIRFWNLRNALEVRKITGVDGEFCDLALDFSGLTLLAGSDAGVLRSWNLLWDYDARPSRTYDEIYPLLFSLTAYYAMSVKLSPQTFAPREYYKLNANNFIKRISDVGPLSDGIVQKIYAEAKYRGLCDVPYATVKEIVSRIWTSHGVVFDK